MRAVIFANGEISRSSAVNDLVRAEDTIVSVDGGMRHLLALGLRPHIIIGDMDSISPGALTTAEKEGVEILRFPPAKDETDLELAINLLKKRGFDQCLVVGALGGRIDQTLANLWLLAELHRPDFRISFDDGCERVDLITDSLTIFGQSGDIVSLIPFGAAVTGITTRGLEYPLQEETLYPAKTRGLSNVLIEEKGEVHIKSGRLLCIQRRDAACPKRKK